MNTFQDACMKKIWNLPIVAVMPFSEVTEPRPMLLLTSPPAWNAVKDKLHFRIAQQIVPYSAVLEDWEQQLSELEHQDFEVVYAVGGGLTADAAKYAALRFNLPLVVMPTALSVDAFITAASGIRKDGCVYYIETKPPENLILDLDVIAAAPKAVRAAGITDVMSIATGCWDWKFAHERGENPAGMAFIPWVYDNAQSILNGVLDCAESAGAGEYEGLKTLYDCLAMEVQLCNQVGHARPEEGSEHYFAYCVENIVGHGLPHGDLVGPGIMLAARLQGQATDRLEKALKACHVPLGKIPPVTIEQTLPMLPEYCRRHRLPYGIAHEIKQV
jgi:glycerol-1-phosphate dehydrogenase [NAD(P)+]